MTQLDILIPVYHEGESLNAILKHLEAHVRSSCRILIAYDEDNDPTLAVAKAFKSNQFEIIPVKNKGRGVHSAIVTGFQFSSAPAVLVYPADDDVNGVIVDELIARFEVGADIVAPSRFMKGGCMQGCRPSKAILVRTAAFLLHAVAGVPVHDPTNGFRLFSQRVLRQIPLRSTQGFTYSIELLVKAQRLGWKIDEVPSRWFERKKGKSRFKIFKWMPAYLRWFFYGFQTRLTSFFWVLWLSVVFILYLARVILPKVQGMF